ncbi:phospholipid/cholesterol/gamma-HCH transport system substrate-binding protein [Mycobacteroides chelonae]|nr:phospholipid/cholesterol/gamma-HCH transport system substrate-binding protein [Mycobacteroides chelonae]
MTGTRRALIYLMVTAVLTAFIYVVVVNGLRNPVAAPTASYQALFNDVSGLRVGADIRRQGVQVGKVTSIVVSRSGDGNVAAVGLDLADNQRVTTATRLSVKFQNLTGARYIDIRDESGAPAAAITRIPLVQTAGSFDITTIFQGLAPILRTVDPADINALSEKLAIFLDGDGAGAADLLDSIRALAATAGDKQQVISALVDNIAVFARQLQGRSAAAMKNLAMLENLTRKLMPSVPQFGPLGDPTFVTALNRLLWLLGLRNGAVLDQRFDVLRANLYRIPEFFERMPGAYSGLQPMLKYPGSDLNCTNGQLALPPMVKVILGDQQVVLCNR